jgi:hypothetical protein
MVVNPQTINVNESKKKKQVSTIKLNNMNGWAAKP